MKYLTALLFFWLLSAQTAQASVCYGTTSKGRLSEGVKLPLRGSNFSPYSTILWGMGRTYVHSSVRDVLIGAYKNLHIKTPGKKFVYAETGFQKGGRFKPHKTHQNGLSMDLMVPTQLIESGESVPFPMSAFNRYGYDVEFNKSGIYKEYKIDFESLGALIVELYKVSIKMDIKIWRVIFAPDLQPLLYKTSHGDFIKKHISISEKKSWVRHDEHIHIDFDIPCKAF